MLHLISKLYLAKSTRISHIRTVTKGTELMAPTSIDDIQTPNKAPPP